MIAVNAAEVFATRDPAKRRNSSHLDALRILAAVGIVILHYSNYVEDNAAGRFVFSHTWHFNLFVDLFFVISGFVIASQYLGRVNNARDTGRFLWRRLARIYPLHLVTLSFYAAIAALLYFGYVHVENPERYALSDIPAQLLLLHAIEGQRLTFNFPSWSLSAEMVCYLLFPLIGVVALRRPRGVLALAFVIATALTAYSVAWSTRPWPEWINQGGAWRALPGFLLGVALYLFRDRVARLPISGVLLPAFLGFVAAGWALTDLGALMLIYLVAVAAVHCDQAGADTTLARLGVGRWAHLTYSSYMLHMPVATVVVTLAGRYVGRSLPSASLVLVGLAAVVLAFASAASYRFFENPVRRALNAAYDRHRESRRVTEAVVTPSSTGMLQ